MKGASTPRVWTVVLLAMVAAGFAVRSRRDPFLDSEHEPALSGLPRLHLDRQAARVPRGRPCPRPPSPLRRRFRSDRLAARAGRARLGPVPGSVGADFGVVRMGYGWS